jgi:hypothetical protein
MTVDQDEILTTDEVAKLLKIPVPFRDAARNGWPFGQHKVAVRGCHQTA